MSNIDIYADGRLVETIIDNQDGTGIRVKFDSDGAEKTTESVVLPQKPVVLPQTFQQAVTARLEQMPLEAAAPVLAVLGWIATLDEKQAGRLIQVLGASIE